MEKRLFSHPYRCDRMLGKGRKLGGTSGAFGYLGRPTSLQSFRLLWRVCSALRLGIKVSELARVLPAAIFEVRRIDEIKFALRPSRPADYVAAYGIWEKPFPLVKPQRGDIVLDIGAHIGAYALRYSRIVGPEGRVIAFEPEPSNRRMLDMNVRLNGAQNIEVRSEALGDFTGTGSLKMSLYSGSHSLARSPHQVGEMRVSVTKLDDLRLPRLDLLKIDAEGWEFNILKGGEKTIRACRPEMEIEVHGTHALDCEVCCFLEREGYSTKILHEDTKQTNNRTHWVKGSPFHPHGTLEPRGSVSADWIRDS